MTTYKSKQEIEDWLNHYDIKNYTLMPDDEYGFVVDVRGPVNLEQRGLEAIKVKFNKVYGQFCCDRNELTSLEGCPKEVHGFFSCEKNKLISLQGGPSLVTFGYLCSGNQLISLKGVPDKIYGNFYCSANKLINLGHAPSLVLGNAVLSHNQLQTLEGLGFTGGILDVSNNQLKALKGCQEIIMSDFYCHANLLENLEYCPKVIKGVFNFSQNRIKNLEFFPDQGYKTCDATENKGLTDLQRRDEFDFFYKEHLKIKKVFNRRHQLESQLLQKGQAMKKKI